MPSYPSFRASPDHLSGVDAWPESFPATPEGNRTMACSTGNRSGHSQCGHKSRKRLLAPLGFGCWERTLGLAEADHPTDPDQTHVHGSR
jgi:hypothetical protein